MTFLLDTDTCIYAMNGNQRVISTLLAKEREEIVVSVITEAELRTGAAKSTAPLKTLYRVQEFLRPLTIADFTSDDAIPTRSSAPILNAPEPRSAHSIR